MKTLFEANHVFTAAFLAFAVLLAILNRKQAE